MLNLKYQYLHIFLILGREKLLTKEFKGNGNLSVCPLKQSQPRKIRSENIIIPKLLGIYLFQNISFCFANKEKIQ